MSFRGMMCAAVVAAAAAAQVSPDPKLRFNQNTYHPVVETLKGSHGKVTDEQLEQLKKLPLEAIWGAVQRAGYTNSHYSGLQSTQPEERLVGRALTIRYLPARPDLADAMAELAKGADWPRGWHVRAAEQAKPGDVVVADLGGVIEGGVFFGDVTALGIKTAGANGVVLYGATRDYMELRDMKGFPVLAVGFDPRGAVQTGVDWNVPVRVGNATVLPGDVVVADAEAVLFFPPRIAAQVIEQATRTVEQEEYERRLVREKKYRFRDVYPLNPELRKKFEAERKKR